MSDYPSLQSQLDQTRDTSFSQMPEEVKTVFVQAMAKLKGSDLAANAVKTGDTAPDFTLPSAAGGMVTLSETVARGPVVLKFFRGGW